MRKTTLLIWIVTTVISAHPTGTWTDAHTYPASWTEHKTRPSWPAPTNSTVYPSPSVSEPPPQTSNTFLGCRPVPSESRYYGLSSATIQTSTPTCPQVQATPSGDPSRADAVKQAYVRSWDQYAQYCFGHDSLFVTNKTCVDDFGGWGVTIVDSLDTAIIMNLTDIVESQLSHIASIDFTYSNGKQPVSAFETTIRYLGGLLSAYDLLTSDYTGIYDQAQVETLLHQAIILADQLGPRFNTPTGLPAEQLHWGNKSFPTDSFVNDINNQTYNSSNLAVCGTFILEYYRLSDLSGDPTYRAYADRATQYLVNFDREYSPIFPNLPGGQLDLDTGDYLTYDFGWRAGVDSFFEYLIKVPIYDTSADPQYLNFWYNLVQSSQANIALSPYNAPDLTYLTQADVCGSKEFSMDDYACFAGGNILLGAKAASYLSLPSSASSFSDLALRVTESCYHLYNTTVSGLGPNQWAWFDAPGHTYNQSWTNNATYQASQQSRSYFILETQYDSYPESIESIWYALRLTGDQMYADWNWQIFNSIQASMDAAQGIVYAGIMDVDQPATLFEPELPSFYFAEVLKYLYLSFTDANMISLDEWVFNTEAHPFRIGGGCVRDSK